MQHYSRFRQIKAVLDPYMKESLSEQHEIASRKDSTWREAYGTIAIVGDLEQRMPRRHGGRASDRRCRKLMFELSDTASKLATKGLASRTLRSGEHLSRRCVIVLS